ncbi:MAG TPA: PD-(D/E)XK nuclease family protein [Saprospiraceae bacterium]|nr:PD-(D/E)XK nuclease family protein [Saprospiraceae bacterium]
MSDQYFDILLNEITTLRKAYELVGRQPGERFNIFRVLGLESDEVRTHSLFLAELLSPAGSHGMGHVFLDQFLFHFEVDDFDAPAAKVTAEFHIGRVSEDEGGRIDLVIESKGRRILIENKIFAGDQPNQLLRYHRFDGDAILYYLTLFGAKPSGESTGNGQLTDEQFTCISYESDILNWLEACREKATRLPNVRETIAQYIELVKQLTNQNFDGKMQTDILNKIFSSPDHLKSFVELQSLTKPVYDRLIETWKPELKKIADDLGLWFFAYLESGKRWQGFAFGGEKVFEEAGIQITFQFDTFPRGLFFGFSYPKDPANERRPLQNGRDLTELKERFRKEFNGGQSELWWACYKKWDDYPADTLCADILSGKINDAIRQRVRTMLDIARETHNPV